MPIVINSAWDAEIFEREREEARKNIESEWDLQNFYETYGGNGYMGTWGSTQYYAVNAPTYNYTYDPKTGEWKKSSASSFSVDDFQSSTLTNELSYSSDTGAISQAGVVNGQDDASTSSKTGAEKEFIDIEFNTLTGEMSLIPTKDNMKINTNNTIRLNGVGKYLSGLYFVAEVRHSLSADGGFSLTIGLFKNGFGDSLKKQSDGNITSYNSRPSQVDVSQNVV